MSSRGQLFWFRTVSDDWQVTVQSLAYSGALQCHWLKGCVRVCVFIILVLDCPLQSTCWNFNYPQWWQIPLIIPVNMWANTRTTLHTGAVFRCVCVCVCEDSCVAAAEVLFRHWMIRLSCAPSVCLSVCQIVWGWASNMLHIAFQGANTLTSGSFCSGLACDHFQFNWFF